MRIPPAARSLLRHRTHSLSVVLALSVGLTVSIATFSVLTSIVTGDQPGIRDRRDLVSVFVRGETTFGGFSSDEFARIRDAGPAVGSLAAEADVQMAAAGRHDAVGIRGAFVSGNYFDVLGTERSAGRFFTPADERADAPPVVVVSDYFWRTQLDGDPRAIGASILLAGRSFTVVGVAPRRFTGVHPLELGETGAHGIQVWTPLQHAREWPGNPPAEQNFFSAFGRLRPGFQADDLRGQLSGLSSRLDQNRRGIDRNPSILVRGHGFGPSDVPVQILLVMAAMLSVPLVVLLIGCANVANMQLARATERSRELAVRAALGATRARLVRLLAADALALSAVAVWCSTLATSAVLRLAGPYFPFTLSLDWRAAIFAALLMIGVTFATGLMPAWIVLRRRAGGDALRQSAHAGGIRHARLRSALVTGQVSLSLLMLCASAVFVRSAQFMHLEAPAPLRSQLEAEFDPRQIDATSTDMSKFATALRSRIERDARVSGVALSRDRSASYRALAPESPENRPVAVIEATTSWFTMMEVPRLAGRLLADNDTHAAVVSARLAETIAAGGSALGQTLLITMDNDTGPPRTVEIVGVVADNRTRPMAPGDRPDPVIYVPFAAEAAEPFAIRIASPVRDAVAVDLRGIVRKLEPRLPWLALRPGEDRYVEDASAIEYMALSIGGLGLLALVLAAAGLYAVIAYVVQLRRREIGIRIAIGADARRITWMVMRQALRVAVIGAAIGLGLAVPLGFWLRSVFVGTVSPLDPIAIGPPVIAMVLVAAAAAVLPARRAARVNPIEILREE